MKINYFTQNVEVKWKNYKFLAKKLFEKTIIHLNLEQDKEVGIILVTDSQMQEMNNHYRGKNYPTDILSFPDDETSNYLGDIFINVDALVRQAKSYKHTLKREFSFLCVHGYLHLLGYDHHTLKQEKEMFSLQDLILDSNE